MDSLTEAFTLAVTSIEENTPFTPNRQQLNTQYALSLYGLHQQGTKGDCPAEGVVPERRKGVELFPGKALVAAWASRRGMTREEAMTKYIDIVIRIAGRTRFKCSSEELPLVQQTLLRLNQALAHVQQAHEPPSPYRDESVEGSTTALSSGWSETSVTQSETESSASEEEGEDSFQSSRESMDGSEAEEIEEKSAVVLDVGKFVRRSRSRQRREPIHARLLHAPPLYSSTPQPVIQTNSIPSVSAPPHDLANPALQTLSVQMETIQISLTALHERLSSLEHAQRMSLAAQSQEGNPWVALARGLGIIRVGKGKEERGWIVRLVMRLLSTARRAAVDVSFILGVLCVVVALRAAVRRRLKGMKGAEGGRQAVIEFWRGVGGVVGKVVEGLKW